MAGEGAPTIEELEAQARAASIDPAEVRAEAEREMTTAAATGSATASGSPLSSEMEAKKKLLREVVIATELALRREMKREEDTGEPPSPEIMTAASDALDTLLASGASFDDIHTLNLEIQRRFADETTPAADVEAERQRIREEATAALLAFAKENEQAAKEGRSMNPAIITAATRAQAQALAVGLVIADVQAEVARQRAAEAVVVPAGEVTLLDAEGDPIETGAPSTATTETPPSSPDAGAESSGGPGAEATAAASAETAPPTEKPPTAVEIEAMKKEYEEAKADYFRWEQGNRAGFTPESAAMACTRYIEARAKYIGGDVSKYVAEEVDLLKLRAERAPGSENKFEKFVIRPWKKLGEIHPLGGNGFWSRFLNARTGVSAALLGIGYFVPVLGMTTLALRRGMGGAGVGIAAYELQRSLDHSKLFNVSDEKLEQMHAIDIEKQMLDLAVYAKLNGSWDQIQPTFQKLQQKYEANLAESLKQGMEYGFTLEDYAKLQISRAKEKLSAEAGSERRREIRRRVVAGGAGVVAATLGPWLFNKASHLLSGRLPSWLGGTPSGSGVVSGASEQFPGETLGESSMRAPDLIPSAPEVSGDRSAFEGQYTGAGAREVAAQAVEAVARLESFNMVFQPGEGPIHEARKAIAKYLAEEGSKGFKALSPAEKLWAEERLWKLTAEDLKAAGKLKNVFHPGESLEFSRKAIGKVMTEVGEKFNTPQKVAALGQSLKDYTGRVNWNRYAVSGGKGLWEMAPFNNGIRAVARVSAEVVASGSPARIAAEVAQNTVEQSDIIGSTLTGSDEAAGYSVYQDSDGSWNVEVPASDVPKLEILDAVGFEDAVEEPVVREIESLVPAFQEAVVRHVSGLPEKYFNVVKDMKIGEIVKKTYVGLTSETRWPWPEGVGPNHADTMRFQGLRDMIRAKLESPELKNLALSEKTKIAAMSAKNFIRTYLAPAYLSRS